MASYEKRTWWTRHRLTQRLEDEGFLEAVVSSAFLIAAADGAASEQEYDALVDRLLLLGGVDRDKIDELFTIVSNDVEASGFEPRIAKVGALVADRDAAAAVFMVAMAVALADDEVSAEEREVAVQLAAGLGIADVDLEAVLAELRG